MNEKAKDTAASPGLTSPSEIAVEPSLQQDLVIPAYVFDGMPADVPLALTAHMRRTSQGQFLLENLRATAKPDEKDSPWLEGTLSAVAAWFIKSYPMDQFSTTMLAGRISRLLFRATVGGEPMDVAALPEDETKDIPESLTQEALQNEMMITEVLVSKYLEKRNLKPEDMEIVHETIQDKASGTFKFKTTLQVKATPSLFEAAQSVLKDLENQTVTTATGLLLRAALDKYVVQSTPTGSATDA